MQRLIDAGASVRVHHEMSAQTLPDADSANVIGELPGRDRPEEVVVPGGHLDCRDAGQGAHDDASGMDGGAGKPVGFGRSIRGAAPEAMERALARARRIGALLEGIGAGRITPGGGGIGPIMREGVPVLGHSTTGAHYFGWRHGEADTLDKIDPREFRVSAAALAVRAYALAGMPERLTD